MGRHPEKDGLGPGSEISCTDCMQRSTAVLHDASLWCDCCGAHLQKFETTDFDRVQLDEDGLMSGRGPPSGHGRICGTEIGNMPGGTASSRKQWSRLRATNRKDRSGPTRSKGETIALVSKMAATNTHRVLALDLLDIGWPGRDVRRANQEALGNPMWRPAHPHGIGSSAAVCLHIAATMLQFDSKFADWVDRCLPSVENAESFGFRSLKRMRKILGQEAAPERSADSAARAILSRANLGETIYGGVTPLIWDAWRLCTAHQPNHENHPRQVLAALCEIIAEREGLPIRPCLIQERFNVGRSFQGWKDKLVF